MSAQNAASWGVVSKPSAATAGSIGVIETAPAVTVTPPVEEGQFPIQDWSSISLHPGKGTGPEREDAILVEREKVLARLLDDDELKVLL